VAGGTSKLPVGLIELRLEQLQFNNPTKKRGDFIGLTDLGLPLSLKLIQMGKGYYR